MVLMDKMKDQSCGIKPAFGYGDGLDLPNLGFMIEPVNVEPVPGGGIPPFFIAQPFNQTALYLGPGLAFIPGVDPPPQQAATGNAAVTGQANQVTNIVDHHPHLSIAEIVANAVQQHIATHQLPQNVTGTTSNESNVHQPEINVAELVTNALQQQVGDFLPPALNVLNTNVAHQGLTNIHTTYQYGPDATNYAHVNATGHSSNHAAAAAAQPSQQTTSEISANEPFSMQIDEETAPESFSDFVDAPMNFYSGVIYNVSSVPLDDESNFSNPAFHAPVSSPVHHPFNPSDDEDSIPAIGIYTPSAPGTYPPAAPSTYPPVPPIYAPSTSSNINDCAENSGNVDDESAPAISIYTSLASNINNCAENSDNVNENQINNPDVPNQSS